MRSGSQQLCLNYHKHKVMIKIKLKKIYGATKDKIFAWLCPGLKFIQAKTIKTLKELSELTMEVSL